MSNHVNDTVLTVTELYKQPLPRSVIFPIFKDYVVEVDGLSEDKTVVVGFSKSGNNINVQCEINGRPYVGLMEAEHVKTALTDFMQSHFPIGSVLIEKWRLADKKNPYLVVSYRIEAVKGE